MAYIGKCEEATFMSLGRDIGIHDCWVYKVYWKREVDDVLEFVSEAARCKKGSTKAIRDRCAKKLDDLIDRYVKYAKYYGVRYEVKKREKYAKKAAARALIMKRNRLAFLRAEAEKLAAELGE